MSETSPSDGWDWPYIMYVGRVWLRYTEEEMWRLTPRQFRSQLSIHEEIVSQRAAPATTGFVDQIPGW